VERWWHNQIGCSRGRERARGGADRAAARVPAGQRRASREADGGEGGDAASSSPTRLAAADRHQLAHGISAPLDGRPLDPPRHRRLRTDRDDGAAGDGGGSPRDDHAADLRGQQETIATGKKGNPSAILVPVEGQQDAREAAHWSIAADGGVEIYRANAAFEAEGKKYAAGTYVIPMSQVFARYAKDMLETQTYPEVRRGPNAPPEPPYDVTAWSLGMLLGVDTVFVKDPLPTFAMTKARRPAENARASERQRIAVRVRLQRRRHGDRDQPPAQRRRAGRVRRRVACRGHGVARSKIEQVGQGLWTDREGDDQGRTRDQDGPRTKAQGPRTSRFTRPASRCINRGPAATWTKAGRGGCWSNTSST
jgi:hypothetical protein